MHLTLNILSTLIDTLSALSTKVCGQHVKTSSNGKKVLVLGFEDATVCLKTVMDQCYTDITDTEEKELFDHAPEVIQKIRQEGCVTDRFLDSLGIPKLPGERHVDRDGSVPWRRHAYMMSHSYSRLDFIDYLQIRNDNNNPVLQQQKKDREQAIKVINRAAIIKQRVDFAASDKVAKIAAKAAEKLRRNNLTVVDRRAEDKLKKAHSAAAKLAKAQATDTELANAVLLIAS